LVMYLEGTFMGRENTGKEPVRRRSYPSILALFLPVCPFFL
jgi:hypothetical protein